MAAKGKRPMRALTAADKIEAIQRVNDGESKASVARDIGVPESTLRGWCKNEDKLRYMSTRHSTPDTDKSSDAEQPPEKRARYDLSPSHPGVTAATEVPAQVEYLGTPPEQGLDLSSAQEPMSTSMLNQEPIELTKPKTDTRHEHISTAPEPQRHAVDLKTKHDAASVSMSAISPLTGLNPLPGVQSGLGLSFNDIASNLSLIAQLNPSLSALTSTLAAANTSAKTLRSIRSPKPSHASQNAPNTSTATLPLNLSDNKYRSSKHDYSERRSKNHYKDPPAAPVDEALWYWLKTQQAMLDLSASASRSMQHDKKTNPKPVAPIQPLTPTTSSLDLNKNSWFWQYYKQFGGAMPLPTEKTPCAMATVPREKNENILYSHLVKGKSPDIQTNGQTEARTTPPTVSPPVASPAAAALERDALQDKLDANTKNHSKARTVLDNLLFNNNNVAGWEGGDETCCNSENEFDGVSEALEHGGKFLSWLEACRDPSVTRMHVHTLRALLTNIRARAARKPAASVHDRVSRRK